MDKVFRIPELVKQICDSSEVADRVHLALTCRILFTLVIPLAWAHVPSVSQLLMLIEGTTCEQTLEDHANLRHKLVLPDNLELNPHPRFKFYAPFVTSLEIYEHEYQTLVLSVPLLESLARFTFTQGGLPNLTRLSITSEIASTTDRIFWIDIFSCRSLAGVFIPCIDFESPIMSYAAASRIVNSLRRYHPSLQKLELFWDDESPASNDVTLPEMYRVPTFNIEATMYQSLSHFTSLTTLIGSKSLMERSMLLALGSLPELQHLEVHYPLKDLDSFELEQPAFPHGSFSKLNTLVLCNIVEPTATSIWKMSDLVAHLWSVSLKFLSLSPFGDDDQEGLILHSFIPLLCTQSPEITELLLEFNCDADEEDSENVIRHFSDNTIYPVTRLKLTRLEVIRGRMNDGNMGCLLYAWPDIEVLRWPDQNIRFADLSLFVENLPRLRHLAMEIDFPFPFDEAIVEQPPRISQCQLRVLESTFHRLGHLNGIAAYKLYWYLRELIPNAKLEIRPEPYLDSLPARKFDLACVNAINLMEQFLELFRQHAPSEDAEKVRKQVGLVWDTVRLNTMKEIQPGDLQEIVSQTAE
ncbi:unnamed protein product [Rhizoctonia solani]|uniref:Uncharacterized protein n=1 Tax=Rhizoctonia solani TaxID=456999 RepID=A0A8H3EGG6_9AGAM|nr:unnamed protein product [Rhizoctonia solani]